VTDWVKLTKYTCDTNDRDSNRRRALSLGFVTEDIRIAPGANVRLGEEGRLGLPALLPAHDYR
jgi:hypothetical protein